MLQHKSSPWSSINHSEHASRLLPTGNLPARNTSGHSGLGGKGGVQPYPMLLLQARNTKAKSISS